MSPVRATALQLSLDLQLRTGTLQLSRYARSKRIMTHKETLASITADAILSGYESRGRKAVIMKP